MPTYILGISAFYHDSAAALLRDGEIVAAAQEERFSRKRHDERFPSHAIQYVLDEAGIGISDLRSVAFYDKPYIKFERLLETYHAFAPAGLPSFLHAIPVWVREKAFMRSLLMKELAAIGDGSFDLKFPEHHLSHAASAFYPSPFDEAAILTVDGVGEWATTLIGHGEGNRIRKLRELHFPHSLGLLYSAFTYYCGFKVNSGEYKLMGLAPYGNPEADETRRFRQHILDTLVDIRVDGSLLLNMDYFTYATGLRMCNEPHWETLFGLPARDPKAPIAQPYMNLALAIQQVTEEIVLKLAETARALTGSRNLAMAGGVALNCVANGRLLRKGTFDRIWIQPAAGDAGGALGAAQAVWYIGQDRTRSVQKPDSMRGALLGPEFSPAQIENALLRYGAEYRHFESFDVCCVEVARLLSEGNAIGWFQGRMEFGPRALGGRSILGDPRNPEMQKRLNLKIKYREGFRPFAPSVMEEECAAYFSLDVTSPYMLLVADVAPAQRKPVPANFAELPMMERLYHRRSTIPAVTHVDFSARVQTVNRATSPQYWMLLDAFKRLTGCPIVVNTSFNVRGEPIVCTPDDAYRCFMRTEMDYLAIGDFLLRRIDQPEWNNREKWSQVFEDD